MHILYMEWPGYGGEFIKKNLKLMGYELSIFDFPHHSEDLNAGEELAGNIAKAAIEAGADIIFSLNYFPVIAVAAHAARVKYISWIYDSPAVLTYSVTICFPECFIFHFDSSEVLKLKSLGAPNVFYLSLAADAEHYDSFQVTGKDHERFDADIAMIGSMYSEDKFAIFKKYENFDEHTKGYLDGLVKAQEEVYGADLLERALTPDIMKAVLKTVPLGVHGDSFETIEWVFANYYLAKRVTAAERLHLMGALSEKYETVLYTREDTPLLPKVINRGWIDYYNEFPLAVRCAKINLNISLKSIHTGIPLRVIDLMACGGFVLTNYQEDMFGEFVPDEDFVYYEDTKDAVEKAGYYLEHDDERRRIADNACRKIRKSYTFRQKLEYMLNTAN